MKKELEKIFRETLFLDDDFIIEDDIFIGSISEWDSLTHMNLIYNISNAYNIEIPFKDLKDINSWKELKEYVSKKLNK